MNIYVGNLSYQLTEEDLRSAFERYGKVDSAKIINDRDTGRSKGFAFVEMPNNEEAEAAINALNGKDLMGRALKVNEARPRQESGRGGGGGGRGGYGGYGNGRGYGGGRDRFSGGDGGGRRGW